MNVFYFLKRFPRRYKTANQQKVFSLAQTFLNQGYHMNFVSADQSHPDQYKYLQDYPINLIHVAPKRISASLSAAKLKPDIALFNNYQMQEMYSAYLYNKWNKCPRILEINSISNLAKMRRKKYSLHSDSFIIPYNENIYFQQDKIFGQSQKKSILRSDFFITPNDFIYYLTKKFLKSNSDNRLALISHGYQFKQFNYQIKNKQYRPFQNRKHFYFLGDLSSESGHQIIFSLCHNIWPLIKKKLPQAQLHIYYSYSTAKINKRKKQYQSQGISFKGYLQNLQQLQKYKALLYPARFSTGLKSKVIQAWLYHVPVVTTPIGAQGMFYQTLQAKFMLSQSDNKFTFVNEREFTQEEKLGQSKMSNYYNSNKFNSNQLKKLSFGGLFHNLSYIQFAESAIQLYTNKQKWQKSLNIGHKTLIKNQNQSQLQINIRQAILKTQLAMYNTRGDKQYQDQWKRFIKNKQYQKKVHQYPPLNQNDFNNM